MAGGESMCPSQFWRSSIHAETQNEKTETYDGKTNDENGKFSNPDNDPWGMTDVFVCWRIKGNGSWLGKIHSMTAPFHESCVTATRITLMRRPTKVLWNFTLSSLRERNFLQWEVKWKGCFSKTPSKKKTISNRERAEGVTTWIELHHAKEHQICTMI